MLILSGMKIQMDLCHAFLLMLLIVMTTQTEVSGVEIKRQGIFGPCQGWGAGCGTNYITSHDSSRRESSLTAPKSSEPMEEVSYIPDNSYLFTSGGSWKPIGRKRDIWTVTSGNSWGPLKRELLTASDNEYSGLKRSAWFTDIPYLRNPLISFPKFNKPQGMADFYRRYPLTYKTLYRKLGGRRVIKV